MDVYFEEWNYDFELEKGILTIKDRNHNSFTIVMTDEQVAELIEKGRYYLEKRNESRAI